MTEGFLEERSGKIYVGAKDESRSYRGPVAEVYIESGNWLRIVENPYDNTLMLNVETAPYLIKAIQKLLRKHKKESK